jgi:hypothetical protein
LDEPVGAGAMRLGDLLADVRHPGAHARSRRSGAIAAEIAARHH